jgi:hypothetical protein
MRTSLNEIKTIENHLFGQLPLEEALVFEAHLIINQDLREKLRWQEKTTQLIKRYGRQKLKEELELVHQQLFTTDRGFRDKILSFFKKRK